MELTPEVIKLIATTNEELKKRAEKIMDLRDEIFHSRDHFVDNVEFLNVESIYVETHTYSGCCGNEDESFSFPVSLFVISDDEVRTYFEQEKTRIEEENKKREKERMKEVEKQRKNTNLKLLLNSSRSILTRLVNY